MKLRRTTTSLFACLLALALAGCSFALPSLPPRESPPGNGSVTIDATPLPQPTYSPTPVPTKAPETPPPTEPPPQDQVYVLSFAGDCTLGADLNVQSTSRNFISIVGEQYDYPFKEARRYFASDDFTLVNFEGTLTESENIQEKLFRFKGPARLAQVLVEGSIEGVTLTNNHSRDYGEEGYEDTKAALDAHGIAHANYEEGIIYETERGLIIGVYGGTSSGTGTKAVQKGIEALKERGAQFIIAAFHFGEEGDRVQTSSQERTAHAAIDAGADMVVGHHSHVLQPVVYYKGKPIAYSLGNFCFGGNSRPDDMDTVVMQQEVIVKVSGEIELGKTSFIPFRMSGYSISDTRNDYQPAPYPVFSEEYYRVFEKLGLNEKGEIVVFEE